MSTRATDGFFYKKKKKNFSSKNDYWKWFVKYGHDIFVKEYGEEYEDHRPDHNRNITRIWNEVKNAPGGWDLASRRREVLPMGKGRPLPSPSTGRKTEPVMQPIRIRKFMRNTNNEVDIRSGKVYEHFTAKLKIVTQNDSHQGRGRSADDVLRELRCFLLVVHEYTSNAAGNRVAPSEITMVTYSLSRGMQIALNKMIHFKQTLVTDQPNLNTEEHNRALLAFEKTGISVPQIVTTGTVPSDHEARAIERVKADLLEVLTEQNSKNAPILVLKRNYNQAAGTLYTLFPEFWERLETRICFLDDMSRVYSQVQRERSRLHPIRDLRDIVDAPLCPFHLKISLKGEPHACTQNVAVRELQVLFKSLSDSCVLDMDKLYDPAKHQTISQAAYSASGDGPQLNFEPNEEEYGRREQRRDPFWSSDSDSDDDSLYDVPSVSNQRRSQPNYGGESSRNSGYGNGVRGNGSEANVGGYDNGYGRSDEYNRDGSKENRRHEQCGGYDFNSRSDGGHRRGGSYHGGQWGRSDNSNDRPKQYSEPPPRFEDRDDSRPAQRRRNASPDERDGRREEEEERQRWEERDRRDEQNRRRMEEEMAQARRYEDDERVRGRRDYTDDRGYGYGSQDDQRRNVNGDGSVYSDGRSTRGGAGSMSRPRRGGAVFGSRTVEKMLPPEEQEQRRRGVNPMGRLPFATSFGGSDSCPISSPMTRYEDVVESAHRGRMDVSVEREERDAIFNGGRNGIMGGVLQTRREHARSPPRDGEKRREDRLNPEFGGNSSRGEKRGVDVGGTVPVFVPATKQKEAPPPQRKEETAEEKAVRIEDETIKATIKFLPRGSYDAHMEKVRREADPRITPTFRPYLWSAAEESAGRPMSRVQEERIDDEMRAEERRRRMQMD